jgi:hypothetical protein
MLRLFYEFPKRYFEMKRKEGITLILVQVI